MSVAETIDLVKKYASKKDEVFVNFSGGRYSLVLLHLVLRALEEAKAVYVDTTISLPECSEFVEETCSEWGVELRVIRREDVDFWNLVKRRGFPHRRFRWCMQEFKSIPLRLFGESYGGHVLHLAGTSMYESSMRKKVYSIRGKYHYNYSIRSYVLHPMLKWTEKMVYDYIETHNLKMNPCYEKYYSSGNCYYCPFVSSLTYYSRLAAYQPRLFARIIDAEKAMRKGGAAIYLGRGKVLHLSKFKSMFESRARKNQVLAKCEARALSKNLATCQKRCLM